MFEFLKEIPPHYPTGDHTLVSLRIENQRLKKEVLGKR
jgi:hypothetical protein